MKSRSHFWMFFPLLGWFTQSMAFAVEEGGKSTPALATSPLNAGSMSGAVLGLLLVLALILGLGWLLKRYGRLPTAGKGGISILGGVSLGTRERAVLLQVENTRILVGVAPGRVETLHVLENGEHETQFKSVLQQQTGESEQ
ncbi:MAG: flagellar biosynthetic protein FliO [Gammaproteobacteria bacterium]|nr:flagellar biosynthetic protein FliO [Gammaproteobacteria bacterium]